MLRFFAILLLGFYGFTLIGYNVLEAGHELLHWLPNHLHHHQLLDNEVHNLDNHHQVLQIIHDHQSDLTEKSNISEPHFIVFLLLFWQKNQIFTYGNLIKKVLIFNQYFFQKLAQIFLSQNTPPPEK
jgi:hypothetical protein